MFLTKKSLILLITLTTVPCLILSYVVIFGKALAQPVNHGAIVLAIPKAIFSAKAVQIDDNTYFAKNSNSFIRTMEKQGFTYTDQMGAGYFFKKDNHTYTSIGHMYSRYFMVFSYPKKGP